MSSLKNQLIRLGEGQPHLRSHIRPILDAVTASLNVRRRDIQDAFEHFNMFSEDYGDGPYPLHEFERTEIPCLPIEKIWYYDDISAWQDIWEDEFEGLSDDEIRVELESFRGRGFGDRAMQWLKTGEFPPIILIVGPDTSSVGDGRGRINVALGAGIECLPAVVFKHKRVDRPLNF